MSRGSAAAPSDRWRWFPSPRAGLRVLWSSLPHEVFAEALAFVLRAEDSAPLEDRHHVVHEIVDAVGVGRGAQVEAVASRGLPDAFDLVGDLLGRAEELGNAHAQRP